MVEIGFFLFRSYPAIVFQRFLYTGTARRSIAVVYTVEAGPAGTEEIL